MEKKIFNNLLNKMEIVHDSCLDKGITFEGMNEYQVAKEILSVIQRTTSKPKERVKLTVVKDA